jgi:hypothetical protein
VNSIVFELGKARRQQGALSFLGEGELGVVGAFDLAGVLM